MTNSPTYAPGYSNNAVQFMARRTAQTHAGFFIPFLKPGMDVLDCGCGPGAITCGLARLVGPGKMVGVDAAESQVREAELRANTEKLANVHFQAARVDSLPFADHSFDAVFSHALFEHLSDPVGGAREIFRVLRPGGLVGLRSPDWGGFILSPPDRGAENALAAYEQIQQAAGGDTRAGRKLGTVLASAGFGEVEMKAEYECYPDREVIAEYLALRLDESRPDAATALRAWSRQPGGLFAQTWVSAVARKPMK